MQNATNQKYVDGLQKAYLTTGEMFMGYNADQGGLGLGSTNLYDGSAFADASVQNELDALVRKYFKVTKVCRADIGDSSCQETVAYLTKPNTTNVFPSNFYTFYTIDGMKIALYLTTSCTSSTATCGGIYADVNGNNPPNKYGRDYFIVAAIQSNGSLLPYSTQTYANKFGNINAWWKNDATSCGSDDGSDISTWGNTVTGQGCTARIMEKGWVMDY